MADLVAARFPGLAGQEVSRLGAHLSRVARAFGPWPDPQPGR
ncbi:MAG TPA: hypothetical protein VE343_01320 [Streptosporangiaceae bacterium]|nr:hypothetical protein [Streptosporangiaceae bacterium]